MRNQQTITAIISDENGERRVGVAGRDAWALRQLIEAGGKGCTPIDNPAPRWSHYVWKLRRAGVPVETITENHGGEFAGHHARYVLTSPVRIVEQDGQVPDRQIAA